MRQKTFIALLSAVLAFVCLSQSPSVKIAFSYDAVDAVNQNIIIPFIPKIVDSALVGVTISFPENSTDPIFEFWNFTCLNFSVNEAQTHLLEPFGANDTMIEIVNMTVTVGNNFKAPLNSGYGTFTISGVNVNLTLGEQANKEGKVGIQILDSSIVLGQFSLTFSNAILEFVFNALLKLLGQTTGPFISYVIEEVLQLYIGPKIYAVTSGGLNYVMNDTILYTVDFGSIFYTAMINGEAFGCQALNLSVTNTRYNLTPPYIEPEYMPDYYSDNTNVQLFISQDTIDKAIWGFLQVDNQIVLDASKVPASSPIQLNTSSLQLLLPNVTKHFGPNLGVYVNVSAATYIDEIFIRDGRLVGFLPLDIDFWVDTDSSNYPQQGFNSCIWQQNCQLGVSMDLSAFFALVLYNVNASYIGASLMNLIIDDVLVTAGYANGDAFQTNLNSLLGALIPSINANLTNGIANPLIGFCGITSTIFNIETDYIRIAMTLTSNPQDPMPCPLPNITSYLGQFIEY